MKQLQFQAISILALLAIFFFGTSAHALTIDVSTLDTMQTQSHGPFGLLDWKGVTLTITNNSSGEPNAQLTSTGAVRIESNSWFQLDQPKKAAFSRIVKSKNGSMTFERADVQMSRAVPALQVTSLSAARLTEIARLDPKVERGKPVPIYAYRTDAAHVVVVVGAGGSNVGHLGPEAEGSCAQTGDGHPCTFDMPQWNDGMVSLPLGDKAQVAQARGDILFDDPPKGETNQPITYIVNASFTQSSRDPEPILAINTRTMPTIFRGESDGE